MLEEILGKELVLYFEESAHALEIKPEQSCPPAHAVGAEGKLPHPPPIAEQVCPADLQLDMQVLYCNCVVQPPQQYGIDFFVPEEVTQGAL